MVLHEAYFLPQQLYLLLVLSERQLSLTYPLLHSLYLAFYALFAWYGDFGVVGAQGLIIAGGDAAH